MRQNKSWGATILTCMLAVVVAPLMIVGALGGCVHLCLWAGWEKVWRHRKNI